MKLKTSVTFDAKKLAKWLQSDNYKRTKTQAIIEPQISMMKATIKKGRLLRPLAQSTIKNRKNRRMPPSIGGITPLYDTGRLVDSLKFDKSDGSLKGIWYAKGHLEGTHLDWNGKKVPKRDFWHMTELQIESAGELAYSFKENKAMKALQAKIRQKFSRRLAK